MQLLRRFSLTMLLMSLMTLVACGGGDLTGGGDDDDGSTGSLAIIVAKSDGDLSAANTVTVYAQVTENLTPVANKTVIFSLAVEGSATLDPIAGTATTDADGIASIVVKVTDVPGSVNVIASYDSVSDNISFNSLGDGAQVIEGEPEAAVIKLFASSQQLASSGAESIELIAVAKDENNNLLEGVTINFSTSSGSLGSDGESTNVTDSNGQVSKNLYTQAEPSIRTILVTVTSGDITDELEIEVVGTILTLAGSSSLALNDEATFVVNLLDSDGNGIAKETVAVSLAGSDADITIPSTVTTDALGQATLSVTGTSGGSNTIVVSSLGVSATHDVSVQSDSFQFTSFSNGDSTVDPSNTPTVPDVSLTQTASVTLTWLREGSAVTNTPVSITTTRGVLSDSNVNTDSSGQVSVTLTSADAGKAILTLVGTDSDIELTNQLEFEFYAEEAATITAQASPNSIGPNEQTSTISVVVKDDEGNLVKNKTIQFLLSDISGGSIYPPTAVTDSSGNASTVYTSLSTSAKDAVVITAVVEDTPAVTTDVSLTVSNRELFISLGTGNEIETSGTTDYIKEYSIFVTDVDSNAVENVALTVSAIPDSYYKGFWVPTYDGDEFISWVAAGYDSTTELLPTHKCPNEDANFNGILDDGEDDTGEGNNDGELTPGNIVSVSGTFITDAYGRSIIRIYYPQSYGHWLDVKLIVSGKVTGSEGSTQTIFKLPVLAEDVINEDIQPPQQGILSRGPFGVADDCTLSISLDPAGNTD